MQKLQNVNIARSFRLCVDLLWLQADITNRSLPSVSPKNTDPVSSASSSPPPFENMLLHSCRKKNSSIKWETNFRTELGNIKINGDYLPSNVDKQSRSYSLRFPGYGDLFSYRRWFLSSHLLLTLPAVTQNVLSRCSFILYHLT